jgi:capsular polysaccharide transport system permease protein
MAIDKSFITPRVVFALMLREMNTTYGRSAIGYLWAFAEPVLGIILLTAAFSVVMRSPPLGTSFALFYASGVIPFLAYVHTSTKTAAAVRFSRSLLVYPRVTFLDAVVARFLLNALTQAVVAYVLLTVLLLAQDTRAMLDLKAIALSMGMALSLGLGVGAMNCVIFSMLPSWERIWGILNRPLFLVSGVFFMFDSMPEPVQDILWWNPLVHVVGMMRIGLYPTYPGDYVSVPYVMSLSVFLTVFGLFYLRRYHKKILNEL